MTAIVEPAPGGFGVTCPCGAAFFCPVAWEYDGVPVPVADVAATAEAEGGLSRVVAVTCRECGTVHWVTVSPFTVGATA